MIGGTDIIGGERHNRWDIDIIGGDRHNRWGQTLKVSDKKQLRYRTFQTD